jgi:hypothetical protein
MWQLTLLAGVLTFGAQLESVSRIHVMIGITL